MRQDVVEATVVYYNEMVAFGAADNFAGARLDYEKTQYERILADPKRIFFVGMESSHEVIDGAQKLTPETLREFADEIYVVQGRCPFLKPNPHISAGDAGLLYAEWVGEVPYGNDVLEKAVTRLGEIIPLFTRRDTLFDIAFGANGMQVSREQRVLAAEQMMELIRENNMRQDTIQFKTAQKIVLHNAGDVQGFDQVHYNGVGPRLEMQAFRPMIPKPVRIPDIADIQRWMNEMGRNNA